MTKAQDGDTPTVQLEQGQEAEIARKNAEDRARLAGIVYYVRPFGGRSDQIHSSEPRFDESEIDRLIKRERLDPKKVDRHQVMRLIVERGR